MGIVRNLVQHSLKNGKKAVKNGVNDVVEGATNGEVVKNGVNYAKKAHVEKALKKKKDFLPEVVEDVHVPLPYKASDQATKRHLTKTYERFSKNKQFIGTHGESWEEAIDVLNRGYDRWDETTSLTGIGTIEGIEGGRYWTNPSTGKTYKLKTTVTGSKVSTDNMTGLSLKDAVSQRAYDIKRARTTEVNAGKVFDIVKRLGGSPDQARAYLKLNAKEKKALTTYIAKVNKKAGDKVLSLGHGIKADSFEDSADIATNIYAERFKTTKKGGKGNAARSGTDELLNELNTALNRSFSLEEDIIKFLDPSVGAFWVGMTNAQKKKLMKLVANGMDMDDALDKIGFGETILGESVTTLTAKKY